MLLNFYLRFSTQYGQSLYVAGSHAMLGQHDIANALPMQYFNNEFWHVQVELPEDGDELLDELSYCYVLKNADGTTVVEWGDDRNIAITKTTPKEITLLDTWNHAGDVMNAFFTKPFQDVFFKTDAPKPKATKVFTHEFRVKAPILKPNEVLAIAGSGKALGDWKTDKPILLGKSGNWWTVRLNLGAANFPVAYKYGVYDTAVEKFLYFENGSNRTLPGDSGKGKLAILHDGFAQLAYPNWKGAGVAIPVFSLRSQQSLGCGEFTDIKLLADWGKTCGLKLIQLLPINDTTAKHTWEDSYPYAAISAFALHPMYLNLKEVAGDADTENEIIRRLYEQQPALNGLPAVDYDRVVHLKFDAIWQLYQQQKAMLAKDKKYFEFFDFNRHWLVPYASFCYLRDKYKTADYNQWATHSVYSEQEIQELASPEQEHYDQIAVHYFAQYHLHLQLKDATAYAHQNGMIVKGDLPIGIYRYGCDAWMAPELYNMDAQAGAPPDDFAVKGQNWGFPTYNWKRMQQDGFAWWRQRFEQMSEYFDAFRIDHILGFFRIWSIPLHAVEGILGRFVPAIPVHINELYQNNISFAHHRYCLPWITDTILAESFGGETNFVKDTFLYWQDGWHLRPEFDTQKKVEQHFSYQPASDTNAYIKQGLFDLISNVIFIEEEGSQMQQFHFRIGMEQTKSFRDLDDYSKQKLKDLYVNYFFRRQDAFWQQEAMNKLPELKRSTNMLVCGEDLGMVPDCVPDVMRQIGALSLEIQRMPKDPKKEFFHPADAPYMSVVTPSTHDMSTIRGWWEEDGVKTQRFFNNELGHLGAAPYFCSGWINREVMIQHLYSPAMWCIFQLQDILGISEVIRRENPNDERINIPADPKHYWRYRMHFTLEELLAQKDFNDEFGGYVAASGRG